MTAEALAVAALVISGAALLVSLRAASRRPPAPALAPPGARAPSSAPAAAPPSPAGNAPDGALLVRVDVIEAKVSVLEARSAQPLPAAPLSRADAPDASPAVDAARHPHPMFP